MAVIIYNLNICRLQFFLSFLTALAQFQTLSTYSPKRMKIKKEVTTKQIFDFRLKIKQKKNRETLVFLIDG